MALSRTATTLAPLLLACCSLAAAADEASATLAAEPAADPEAELDEGLKRFGYLAGLTRGCVIEEQRVDLEREALDLSGAIGRLFGTDRAFLFASAFGYGTSIEVEAGDCAEVIRSYDERVANFRARRGSAG